jgi:hypothetical protein
MIKNTGKQLWNSENKFKTKSTEVLRHSNMQLTSGNMGEHGESIRGMVKT